MQMYILAFFGTAVNGDFLISNLLKSVILLSVYCSSNYVQLFVLNKSLKRKAIKTVKVPLILTLLTENIQEARGGRKVNMMVI